MIESNNNIRGYQTRLAKVANIHTSYLSKVLGRSVHLTIDQALLMGEFWHLSQEEKEYLIILVSFSRAATLTLKNVLQKQIDTYKKNHEDLSKRIKNSKTLSSEKQSLYYSLWYYSAIHMLIMIPEFQTVEKISLRLQINSSVVLESLSFLQEMGLVLKDGPRWKAIENNLHLSNSEIFSNLYHANWRQRTAFHLLNNLTNMVQKEELHFSSLYAISKNDFSQIKSQFLDLIEKSRAVAQKSPEEDVYFFSIDAFKI